MLTEVLHTRSVSAQQSVWLLTPIQRRIVMALIAGQTTKQIREELSLSAGALNMQIQRGRRRAGQKTCHQLVAVVAANLVRMEARFASIDNPPFDSPVLG